MLLLQLLLSQVQSLLPQLSLPWRPRLPPTVRSQLVELLQLQPAGGVARLLLLVDAAPRL